MRLPRVLGNVDNAAWDVVPLCGILSGWKSRRLLEQSRNFTAYHLPASLPLPQLNNRSMFSSVLQFNSGSEPLSMHHAKSEAKREPDRAFVY